MRRLRLSLQVLAADVPRAEAFLELAGAETLSLHDAADDPVLEPDPSTAPLWPNVIVRALFASDADLAPLCDVLRTSFAGSIVTVDALEDAQWQRGLHQELRARKIGRRIWLAPADDERPAPDGRIAVRLNMGLAFGTGEHPTTALCLEWLDEHLNDRSTVLDYGCGSGILAIAALALGAKRAWAVDNDPQALLATRANAALNAVAERLTISPPETLPAVAVDVLVANILARPLIELAPTFAARVRAGGSLVLSGVLERQAAEVAAAYAPYFDLIAPVVAQGWACLGARRLATRTT